MTHTKTNGRAGDAAVGGKSVAGKRRDPSRNTPDKQDAYRASDLQPAAPVTALAAAWLRALARKGVRS